MKNEKTTAYCHHDVHVDGNGCSGDWLPYYAEVDFTSCKCRYLKLICKEGNRASLAKLDVILHF